MVRKDNIYTPKPVYNRRLARQIIRNKAIAVYGYHNVSEHVHTLFGEYQKSCQEDGYVK